MWIKRAEWVKLLTEKAELQVRAEIEKSWGDSYKKDAVRFNQDLSKANVHIKELEARILEMQDELNQANKRAAKPVQVVDAESIFGEDKEIVEKMRRAIKSDGADALLAKELTDSSLGEL